jgi:hypothetical protein
MHDTGRPPGNRQLGSGGGNNEYPNLADDTPEPAPNRLRRATPTEARDRAVARGDSVELIARVPHVSTRVTITIDVEPHIGAGLTSTVTGDITPELALRPNLSISDPTSLGQGQFASGRELPKLLFATHPGRLAQNIGVTEADRIMKMIRSSGQEIYEIREDTSPYNEVAQASRNNEGVVLIGGYDVLPAARLDVLESQLRQLIGHTADLDDFIVWSDEAYGDDDGDGIAERPVSRVPDAHDANLIRTALCSAGSKCNTGTQIQRFGIRNVKRPFAEQVFKHLDGLAELLVSEPIRARNVNPADVAVEAVYFMLHGADVDTSRFWGERVSGGPLEAFNVEMVPLACASVVLAGCCWGALTVRTKAAEHVPGDPIHPVPVASSIALKLLGAGASAFVGCTGSHYSPMIDGGYFGGPMHSAFWADIKSGNQPAKALFNAKKAYALGMPHGRNTPMELAIEMKILREFTCLGLGW